MESYSTSCTEYYFLVFLLYFYDYLVAPKYDRGAFWWAKKWREHDTMQCNVHSIEMSETLTNWQLEFNFL